MSDDSATKVLVTNVPPGCKRDKLHKYFQKKTNGGGDIKSFAYPIPGGRGNAAVIEFVDETVAQNVIAAEHHELPKNIRLRASEFEPGLFESAKVHMSKPKFEEILKKHSDMNEFIEESGVTTEEKDGSLTLLGEWYQILSVGERLQQLSLPSNENDFAEENNRTPSLTNISTGSFLTKLNEDSPQTNADKEGKEGAYTASDSEGADRVTATVDEQPEDLHQTQMEVDQDYGTPGSSATAMHSNSGIGRCQLTLDKDIIAFMDLTMEEKMDNLKNQYQITFKNVGEATVAEFGVDGEFGKDTFGNLYQKILGSVEQESFIVPKDLEMKKIEKVIANLKTRYPRMHISLLETYDGAIIFIADSPNACSEAVSELNSRLRDLRSISREWDSGSLTNYSSERLFVRQFPDTGLQVTIYRGDIAAQSVDAIVNAANAGLRDGAGVTGAIFRAGGDKFRRRCRDLIRFKDRSLDIGEVVHTTACGRLQCGNVLHVVGPVWNDLPRFEREEECQKIMDGLCYDLIKYANHEVSSKSIAIPAIGTGIYGVPLSIFCNAMVKSIYSYQDDLMAREQTASLREIRIVNYDVNEANEIKRKFEEVLRNSAPESTV